MNFTTVPEMFLNLTDRFKDTKPAFQYKQDDKYVAITFTELRETVECLAIALMELGIRKNDRVGIASENRIEWIYSDFAIVGLGAVDVPVFPTLTAKQEEYIFSDCEAVAIIVSNNFQLNKVLQFKANLPTLRHIIVMNDDFKCDDVSVHSMSKLIKRGAEIKSLEERKAIFVEAASKVQSKDLLTLIYTSGTTGEPKGVMLTHKNLMANVWGCVNTIHFSEKDHVLSFLPLCHSYERATAYYSLFSCGATISLAEAIETVAANILETKPTIMTTVPRLLETVKKKIFLNVEQSSHNKQKIFYWAVKVGKEHYHRSVAGTTSIALRTKYKVADKLVFSKIREKLGGKLELMVSGGAALTFEVAEFFLAAGITVIQGYGLTEASPVVCANTREDNELGTIGKPLKNVEVKLAPDGEIICRGPNVMQGYWNDKEATEKAIDDEGWLYTGDIGVWTEKGNIKITDRKKNIFVSSGGKNIAPQPIENLLSQSKYFEHIILIGDSREYCTALITPDFEQLRILADDFGISYEKESELISNEQIIRHLKKDIDYYQKDLAKYERVRKFSILSKPFTVEDGELSPKMSIKRHVVEKKYAEFIERMYGSGS